MKSSTIARLLSECNKLGKICLSQTNMRLSETQEYRDYQKSQEKIENIPFDELSEHLRVFECGTLFAFVRYIRSVRKEKSGVSTEMLHDWKRVTKDTPTGENIQIWWNGWFPKCQLLEFTETGVIVLTTEPDKEESYLQCQRAGWRRLDDWSIPLSDLYWKPTEAGTDKQPPGFIDWPLN